MTKEEAYHCLDNLKWLKGYDNTTIGGKTVGEILDEITALLKEQEAQIEQLNRFVNGFSRDAMPVVRCEHCKWYDERISMCDNCGLPREQTFFCADGERKEGR